MGERGDIIRTMQRELTARKLERAPVDRVIFDPAAEGAAPIVGRVVTRGLADEHEDRHYLLIDGIDGRTHYAEIGKGEAVRSEEHTSELQSLMRTSYAVSCLNTKQTN